MGMLAIKDRSNTKQKQGEVNRAVIQLSHRSPNSGVLQRKASCACGGGCPRCREAALLQPKLRISEPGDRYEQEADRIADQVMQMPEPTLQRQAESEEEEGIVRKRTLSNQITPLVHRQVSSEVEEDVIQTKTTDNQTTSPASTQVSSEVPFSVHEALSSPGQSLDPATRAFTEPRFGYNFSRVRVHTDSKAAKSARDLNANAYTVGWNIVFGAGQFLPGTQMGQRLLSHELTHVVQQQCSPIPTALSLDVAGDFHKRQAGAVAKALRRGGNLPSFLDSGSNPDCSLLQRDTPQGPSPAPRQPAPTPPPPRTLDYDRTVVHSGMVPQNVTADSLKKSLQDKVRGREIRSFAVKGVQTGTPAEIFLLFLLWNLAKRTRWGTEADIITAIGWPSRSSAPPPQGLVTVRIDPQGAATAELLPGSVPAIPQAVFKDGLTRLKADFGFADVKGWSGQKPADAAEISDVLAALELLQRRAPQDIPALMGVELIRVPSLSNQRGGEFFAGSQVVLGASADVDPYLKLADLAFASNKSQFFGGGPNSPPVPASFQTILHEVGHAVETEQLRQARKGYVEAVAEEKKKSDKLSEPDPTYDARLKTAQEAAKKPGKKKKDPVAEFYDKEKAAYKKKEEDREEATKRKAEADKQLKDTRDLSSQHTRRLQKFIDLIDAKNIRRFTQYSATHWPQNPDEFYAEAYSLWLVDPAFMQTNYRDVYDFFQSGQYRQ